MSQLDFIFGLGIFLFGMFQLERGIRRLSDAKLRSWLRNSTKTPLGSVSIGVVTTALLQSSSMVSLLVLAFASAGLLPLVNAIGVILGANLGTTMTGWIVATIGFKLDLEAMALPLLGLAGMGIVLLRKRTRPNSTAIAFFGLGMLLFGLSIMKTSMEAIPEQWDVSLFSGHHPIVYLLLGMVITFLIQSSSAAMMMALTALNAGLIALPEAAALVIGADLGTTSTTILGSIYGNVIKRKLAFAHCSFNFIVDISAFIFLLPFLPGLLALLTISDPLYGLVAFHSIMNLLGIIAFVPFLSLFANWIEKIFSKAEQLSPGLLDRVPADIPEAALVAMRDTTAALTLQAICNSMRLFSLHPEKLKIISEAEGKIPESILHEKFEKGYEDLKLKEGDLLRYSLKVQANPLDESDAELLEHYCGITRQVIYSNKTLKDIHNDLDELRHSDIEAMQQLYIKQQDYDRDINQKLLDLLLGDHTQEFILEELSGSEVLNNSHYQQMNEFVYSHAAAAAGDGTGLSTQLNVNHEIHHATKSILRSVQDLITTNDKLERATA